MANKIKGLTIEIGGETTALTKALGEVNKTTRNLKAELRDVERLLKLDPGNTELVAQKQKILAESVDNTAKKLVTLKEAEKQAQEQFRRGEIAEDQYRAIQREVIRTEEELKKLNTRLKEMDWKGITDGLDKFGAKATQVGKTLTTRVTAPIVAAGAAGAKMAMDLEHGIKKITTLADKEILPVEKIKKEVRAISDASGKAQTEIAEATYSALSAGVESAKVFDFVRSGIALTRAGFTDMETVIDATTTVLNAYGDKAFEVSKIHDIFVQTQDKGKITVDELGKSLGRVIPTASSLEVSLDELGASYAILTAKGQKADLATTNLNSMLAEMGKTGSKTDEALREMSGKSFAGLIADGKSVGDVLGMINEHAKDNALSLKDMFGSMTAGSAAVTLLSGGVDGYNKMLAEMDNSTGKAAENAKTMEDGLYKIQKATTQAKNALIEFGATVTPVIEKAAELISSLTEKFAGMSDGTKQVVFGALGVVAAIGPLLIVVGKMATGLSALIKLFAPLAAGTSGAAAATGGLSAAIGAIAGPIALAIAAIIAVTAILVTLWKTNEEFRDAMKEVWENVKQTIDGVLKIIKGIIQVFIAFFTGDWEGLKEGIINIWTGLWQTIRNVLDGQKTLVVGIVKALVSSVKNIFIGAGKDAFNWGKGLVGGFIDGIKSMGKSVATAARNIMGGVKDYIGFKSPSKKGEGRYIVEWGKNMVSGFIDGVDKAIPDLHRALSEAIPSMSNTTTIVNKNMGSIDHTGTITVRGVNDKNELIAVIEQKISKNISNDGRRLPDRPALSPI